MATAKVPAKEVLQDIKSGMDDNAIRQKYNLSVKGLKNLYAKLVEAGLLGNELTPVRRRLNIADILADIKAGMSHSDLMKKYKLSEALLREVSKKILNARGKRSAHDGPETVIEEHPEFLATLEFVRHEVDFDLPVYEASQPEIQGRVRDISEEGLGVMGIEAKVGDVKTLVILGDEFGQFSAFELEGYCRWRFADAVEGTCLTGFAISKITKNDLLELQKLIRLITTGG